MWRETFKAMIHRAHVETAIKATRLKSCLEDHKDLINLKKAIRPTAESYRRALETLEKRFGGSARCANYYIERIAAMEKINSAHKIESLVCEIANLPGESQVHRSPGTKCTYTDDPSNEEAQRVLAWGVLTLDQSE